MLKFAHGRLKFLRWNARPLVHNTNEDAVLGDPLGYDDLGSLRRESQPVGNDLGQRVLEGIRLAEHDSVFVPHVNTDAHIRVAGRKAPRQIDGGHQQLGHMQRNSNFFH